MTVLKYHWEPRLVALNDQWLKEINDFPWSLYASHNFLAPCL